MSELIHRDYLNPVFLLSNLRPHILTPKLEVRSIADINLEALQRQGIRGIIYDVDNTLCPYHGTSVYHSIEKNFRVLRNRFRGCIISNTSDSRRKELEEIFGLPIAQSKTKKPRPEPYQEAMELMGTTPSETAMIGDRLLTDVAGANRLGIYSVKVNPIELGSEPVNIMIARGFETFILRFYQE